MGLLFIKHLPYHPRMKILLNLFRYWEWALCTIVLLTLTLFVLGHDWLGLNSHLSMVYATGISLVTAIITFFTISIVLPALGLLSGVLSVMLATLILPLLTLITTFLAAVTAAFITLATPLLTLISTLWAWLMSTWIGAAIISPLQSTFWPIVSKIAPWITVGRGGQWMWDIIDDTVIGRALIKTWQTTFKRASGAKAKQRRHQPIAASQSDGQGRSSGQGSRHHAPTRKRK